jgi:integrase
MEGIRPYYDPVTKDEREWVKSLPAFLVDILRDHLELFPFHDEFLFTSREGLLIRKRNFYRRWYIALERAGLPRMTPILFATRVRRSWMPRVSRSRNGWTMWGTRRLQCSFTTLTSAKTTSRRSLT